MVPETIFLAIGSLFTHKLSISSSSAAQLAVLDTNSTELPASAESNCHAKHLAGGFGRNVNTVLSRQLLLCSKSDLLGSTVGSVRGNISTAITGWVSIFGASFPRFASHLAKSSTFDETLTFTPSMIRKEKAP